MDTLLDERDRDPQSCLAVGLDCRSCVCRSAENVAAICHGMTPRAVHNIFVQLYPSPACAGMAMAFESAYCDASVPRRPLVRTVAAA